MKSAYITDSPILREGHGGAVVSYHELNALSKATEVRNIYQNIGTLLVEDAYPNNPFMRDYYIASLIENPDEIELAKFYGSSWTLTMKRLSKAKTIMTVSAHNLERSIEEWRSAGLTVPRHLSDPNLFAFLCRGLTEADVIICPSTNSADYLVEKLGVRKPQIIPHGTDLPETWNVDREFFIVSNIGQAGPDKGLTYLAQAWILGNFKGQLIFAGSTIQTQNNPTGIVCLGYVSESQKNELYAKSSVYVAPSVTEGFGITVLEAMAHGTPVIVSEGVGAKDCVTDGHDGFIVPIRNPKAIAEKLLYFVDNPSEVKRMGENARKKAEQYSWDKIEAQYVKLYESC